jgi:transcriptional regulator with PAS, ATPase and Fis domain
VSHRSTSVHIPEVILDSLPSGIIFCDTECNILYINPTYAEYLGVRREEVIGKPIYDFIPGSRIGSVLETAEPELGFKCSVGEGKDKKILVVNRIPVKSKEGDLLGVISQSLFGDIGELKDLSDRIAHLEKKVMTYREKMKSAFSSKYSLDDIKGGSAAILEAKELLSRYARTDSPVLMLGDTGTGKELFAHSLHGESSRSWGPFISINCASIPRDLFESELFGYAPGAFTGAQKDGKMGKVELADKGTLFLDEIGDMPLHAQGKLLRVLEEKMVYRLGGNLPKKVTFRLLAATNRDLKSLIEEGGFREDLYYRLSAMVIRLPSLSERREDIPVLARHMLECIGRPEVACSERVLDLLSSYRWPGNIRELKNVLERGASLCSNNIIDLDDLPPEIRRASAPEPPGKPDSVSTLSEHEKDLIAAALSENGWNMARTAKRLGISRSTLYEKTNKFGISRPAKKP